MKRITLLAALLLSFAGFSQETIITSYVDAPCSGAVGRVLEIYVDGSVDLTGWNVVRQSNGSGFTTDIDLSSFGTIEDDFIYLTNDEATFTAEFGVTTNILENTNINSNGNDAFQIVDDASNVIDRFGEENVDGAGTAWEHTDSYYQRNDMETANGGTFDANNWTFGAIDALDGEGLCNGGTALGTLVPLGVFVPNGGGATTSFTITEIFSGQEGDDLTADWFEIENTGTTTWVSGTDPDFYYDDDSADPAAADVIQGLTDLAPGEFAIVLVTGDPADITTFTDVWSPVINLTEVEIGYTDGAGLGGGGDTVTLWLGDPNTTSPIDAASYPDTALNDGQSYDNDLGEFSTVGNANGAVETIAQGGAGSDVPNIGSPGNGPAIETFGFTITEIFSGQEGDDLTADWFEIENTGTATWVSGTDPDFYYDDDSADPAAADVIQGLTDLAPGEFAIVLVTGDPADITTFTDVWSPVIDLTGVEIGYTDGAGLGGGGDTVTLWLGDPNTTSPIDAASYPDTASNDGQSYDNDLGEFSTVGNANGAVETIAQGGNSGDVPNIGSPGNGAEITLTQVAFNDSYISISEDGGSVTISVVPTVAPTVEGTVEVALIAGGSAVEGTDFTFAASETLTFAIGSTDAQEVTLPIINNTDDGSDVFFVLQLENGNNIEIGGNDVFSVYILDDDTEVPAGNDSILDANYLTSYTVDADGTAEISAYDPASQRLFVTNATKIEVLDFSDPSDIQSIATLDVADYGGAGVQSVAVNNGLVAFAVSVDPKTDNGLVILSDIDGANEVSLEVGALPDMLTFTPDGSKIVVANEGEPNDDYDVDPEGTISVIDVTGGLAGTTQANVTTLNFNAFDSQQAVLEAMGVRIFGPGASVSQDLEPEYVAISNDSQIAYVSLQENNAYAVVNLSIPEITEVKPFGLKDHSLVENSLDTSDEPDFIFNASWPIYGVYMPDAISYFEINGNGYIATANEGDARDYAGYAEERKLDDSDYNLDPTVFSNIDILEIENNLGDLNFTIASGDTDNDGLFEEMHAFGGRSFSIFEVQNGTQVYDSGNDFEVITANDATYGAIFNASNDNNEFKNRSDNKGPEPEGVLVKEINGNFYAFVLLERIGGLMIYDVTDPENVEFLQYLNNRENTPGEDAEGDLGPEGIVYVSETESPTGTAMIVLSNEVSGTLTMYTLDNIVLGMEDHDFAGTNFSMFPNPSNGQVFFSKPDIYTFYDITGRKVFETQEAATVNTASFKTGMYIVSNSKGISKKLIVK